MSTEIVEECTKELKNGGFVILVDDECRENEGDLVLAADFVTPEKINFLAREARGLICLALTAQQTERLGLSLMVPDGANRSRHQTAFTVSIEASSGVTTGISAFDRSHTIWVASRPEAKPEDVISPGHVFPIRSAADGLSERLGHTEGSLELVSRAGLQPAAVICEVMNSDGSMARLDDLRGFGWKHQIPLVSIRSLLETRASAFSGSTDRVEKKPWGEEAAWRP